MTFNFPSRFLKKLEIYQQIRSGQGLSKHKNLWKYEAAFLQTAYGEKHQHLSNFVSRTNFKEWIEKTTRFQSGVDESQLNNIIANLFWRGYIDIVKRINSKTDNKEEQKEMREGLPLFDRETEAYKSDVFGEEKAWDYRPTLEGLLVGEVLTEVNNHSRLLRLFNWYKYNFILDILWVIALVALVKFIFGESVINNLFSQIEFRFWDLSLANNLSILAVVFLIPFFFAVLRKIYICIENCDE